MSLIELHRDAGRVNDGKEGGGGLVTTSGDGTESFERMKAAFNHAHPHEPAKTQLSELVCCAFRVSLERPGNSSSSRDAFRLELGTEGRTLRGLLLPAFRTLQAIGPGGGGTVPRSQSLAKS